MSAVGGFSGRPGGLTPVSVLAILIGLLGIGGGGLLVSNGNFFVAALSVSAVLIGVLYLVTGVGLLRASGWAWTLGMVVSFFALARNLVEIAGGAAAYGVPGVLVAVILVLYLSRPRVKAFFGKASGTDSTRKTGR